MKFTTKKETLLIGIQTVQNVITTKSPLPILSNILLEAQEDTLRLTATDLDVGISCVIPVNVGESGSLTIPAKRFGDIIKELPVEEVEVTSKKNNLVVIESPTCQFKVMGLAKEEFPKLPEFKDKEAIQLNPSVLKKMLALTSFAVSFDETKYILNGILFKIHQNKLILAATDGKRLAVAETKIHSAPEKEVKIIVPIKTIHELNRNLREDEEFALVLGANQVLFDLGSVVVISRLIEGEFPAYERAIPQSGGNKIRIEREAFLSAVRRASLLTTPDSLPVKLEVFKNKLVVSKSTPDVGESREEVKAEYQGKEMAIGFNPAYLLDVLKNLGVDIVEFELSETEKPGVIRDDGYVYMVMPMYLS